MIGKTANGHYYYVLTVVFSTLWAASVKLKHIAVLARDAWNNTSRNGKQFVTVVLVVICYSGLFYSAFLTYPMYTNMAYRVGKDHSAQWDRLRDVVRPYKKVFSHRLVTPVLVEQGKKFYDSGHLPYALAVSSPKNRAYLRRLWRQYMNDARKKLDSGYYDAIFRGYKNRDVAKLEDFPPPPPSGYKLIFNEVMHTTIYSYHLVGWAKK
jgi:hypothetical protein